MTPRKLPQPRNVAGITGLIIEEAPKDFVEALACLMDEAVAKKAFLVEVQALTMAWRPLWSCHW